MDQTSLYIIFIMIFIWMIVRKSLDILGKDDSTLLKKVSKVVLRRNKSSDKEEVENIMKSLGYEYDIKQDIFYSRKDAWQRKYGYCRLYDEAASSFGMILDSEPIYFEYDNKRWLIEFWKGQYGICTGGEVGIYQTEKDEGRFSDLFKYRLYNSIQDEAGINVKFSLMKNGEKLFTREDRHWWLTGFILGQYSEPSELEMNIEIMFEDKELLQAFLKGLKEAGYYNEEVKVSETIVKIKFKKPHTNQPYSRTDKADNFQQMKNKLLCDSYNSLIDSNLNSFDNLVRLKEIESDMFDEIINLPRSMDFIDIYESVKNYIK